MTLRVDNSIGKGELVGVGGGIASIPLEELECYRRLPLESRVEYVTLLCSRISNTILLHDAFFTRNMKC